MKERMMSESNNSTQAYVFGHSVGEAQSILQHLRDRVLALRQLVRHLRPSGIVAFQEADLTRLGTSIPPVPLFEQVGDWIKEPFRREGLDIQFGLRLYRVFLGAGLPAPQI